MMKPARERPQISRTARMMASLPGQIRGPRILMGMGEKEKAGSGARGSFTQRRKGRKDGPSPLRETLHHNLPNHAAVHVGQAEVAAGVTIGQLFVVEAQKIEQGSVHVVD